MVLTRSSASKAKKSTSPTASSSPSVGSPTTSPSSENASPPRGVTTRTIDKEIDAIFKELLKALDEQSILASTEGAANQVYEDRIARYHGKLLALVQERLERIGNNGGHVATPLPSSSLKHYRTLAKLDEDITALYNIFKNSKNSHRRKSRGSSDAQVLGESIVYTQHQLVEAITERLRVQQAQVQERIRVQEQQNGWASSQDRAAAAGTSGGAAASVSFGSPASNGKHAGGVTFSDLTNGNSKRRYSFAGAPTPANTPAATRASLGGTSPSTMTAGSFQDASSHGQKPTAAASSSPESPFFSFGFAPAAAASSSKEQATQQDRGSFGNPPAPANPADGWMFGAPAPSAGGRLFGSPGAAPAPSGTATDGLFGSSPAPPTRASAGFSFTRPASAPGPQPSTSSGFSFGTRPTFPPYTPNEAFGTTTDPSLPKPAVPFQPTVAPERSTGSNVIFQSITAMPEYRDSGMSFEELRWQEYQAQQQAAQDASFASDLAVGSVASSVQRFSIGSVGSNSDTPSSSNRSGKRRPFSFGK